MRNVFDQYNHSENRLTHALVASLAADPPILRGFIRWVTGEKAPATPLNIVEQTNPVYSGWVVSGEDRVRGIHEPLVSDDLFQTVQKRLNGKSTPHKKLNEDFPLRGVVRCATCGNPLTAGSVKGRSKHYARYWCWASDCKAVGVSREYLEGQFVSLLSRMQPTAESLAQLPELAS